MKPGLSHTTPPHSFPPLPLYAQCRFLSTAFLLMFSMLWLCSFFPFDRLSNNRNIPIGADFLGFYVLGSVCAQDPARTYDFASQQQRISSLFPDLPAGMAITPGYPPIVALVFSLLSPLPYPYAALAFHLLSALALLGSAAILSRLLQGRAGTGPLLLVLAGLPVAQEAFWGGQLSTFGLFFISCTVYLIQQHQLAGAGVMLALCLYKPGLFLAGTVAILIRHPRTLKGFIPVLLLVALLQCWYFGGAGVEAYLQAILPPSGSSGSWKPWPPYKQLDMGSYLQTLGLTEAPLALAGLSVMAGLALGLWGWKNAAAPQPERQLWMALLLCGNALLSPYLPLYDLVILAPALALWLTGCAGNSPVNAPVTWRSYGALLLLYFGPHMAQFAALGSRLQLFPLLLLALVWGVYTTLRHCRD